MKRKEIDIRIIEIRIIISNSIIISIQTSSMIINIMEVASKTKININKSQKLITIIVKLSNKRINNHNYTE